ncbi:MAG: hypothetical protein ACW98A_09920 [Candidatus Hodarchaeales archaeon]
MEVDKEDYYPDEIIKIDAFWALTYNPLNEEAHIQVKISDEFDTVIWNSSKYYNIGNFSEHWDISISSLNLTLKNYTHSLNIKFVSVHHKFGIGIISNLLETIQVKIYKRIPLCQLIGFRDTINYGEILIFQAKFFDNFIENSSFLNNQLINFLIRSNGSIIFQSNFTTNHLGIIDISLSSDHHLSLGENNLIFILVNNNVYNDSDFQFDVFLEKGLVFIDVLNFKDDIGKEEDFLIELYYYYFFNNTQYPLENQYIEFVILNNQNITYSQVCITNQSGILSVIVPYEKLTSNKEINELKLNIIFNGSLYLESKTLSLNLNIYIHEVESINHFNIILFASILSIILISSLMILFKFKRVKKKVLPEIIIRY